MKAHLADLQANRRTIFRQVSQHIYQILMDFEDNNLGRWRKALFGEEQKGAYEMLADRIAFVESGRDDFLFLEQYVLLGNYQKDEDRFETFDGLLMDLLRETVLMSSRSDEIAKASRIYQDSAEFSRGDSGRACRSRRTARCALAKAGKGGGMLARVGIVADASRVRVELSKIEPRIKELQAKLDQSGPQLEAAKNKADFTGQEYDRMLGDYLNEPENAHRLFDADWEGNQESPAERARRLDALGVSAGETRPVDPRAGQL